MLERLFKACSAKRPFRCRACDWRGWLVDISPFSELPADPSSEESSMRREPLDLDSLTTERLRELTQAGGGLRR